MVARILPLCYLALALVTFTATPACAEPLGDNQFPNSIMAPEPGRGGYHRSFAAQHRRMSHAHPSVTSPAKTYSSKTYPQRHLFTARGSSGSVLPTPLPKTQLIPPEGTGTLIIPALPQQQGPTIVPGLSPVPNLAHGPETFQDRASRCAFQQGLYNVPGGASSQYMGACLQ
jgi:hypothetical protein